MCEVPVKAESMKLGELGISQTLMCDVEGSELRNVALKKCQLLQANDLV
jgi:hypothetical protein